MTASLPRRGQADDDANGLGPPALSRSCDRRSRRRRTSMGRPDLDRAGNVPWPVFVINVVGSVLLGVLLAEEWPHSSLRVLLHDAGGIGFCGGLTTFSTFSVEVVNLTRAGQTAIAIVYTTLSLLAAIAGVVAGAAALRRLRAVALPLEERP